MDLSWKDKFFFYVTDIRQKLPLADNPKKQLWVFGGAAGGILVVFYILLLVSIEDPTLISSSALSHLGSTSQTNTSNTATTNPNTGNTTTTALSPAPGNQSNAGTNGSGNGNNNTSSNASNAQTQTGKSQVVLQSQPFPTPNRSGSSEGGNPGSSSSGGGNTNATPTPLAGGVIGTNLPTIPPISGTLSGTPPDDGSSDITYQTYFNSRDLYSIDYPVDWQAVKTLYNNHEGVGLYPPGTDTSLSVQDGLEEIGFGISQYTYQIPYVDSTSNATVTNITIDGYPGTLYMQNSSGVNTAAAVFKYGDNYFGLGGTINTNDMISVFNHMLSSLILYGGSYN